MTPNVNTAALLACPCGAVPKNLSVQGDGMADKWGTVSGDCCGEWSIEFRNQYAGIPSEESTALATVAWNAAPRQPLSAADRAEVVEAGLRGLVTGRLDFHCDNEDGVEMCEFSVESGSRKAKKLDGQRVAIIPLDELAALLTEGK